MDRFRCYWRNFEITWSIAQHHYRSGWSCYIMRARALVDFRTGRLKPRPEGIRPYTSQRTTFTFRFGFYRTATELKYLTDRGRNRSSSTRLNDPCRPIKTGSGTYGKPLRQCKSQWQDIAQWSLNNKEEDRWECDERRTDEQHTPLLVRITGPIQCAEGNVRANKNVINVEKYNGGRREGEGELGVRVFLVSYKEVIVKSKYSFCGDHESSIWR